MNNPSTRQEWILEQLTERPTLSYRECFGRYSVNFGKTERTFDRDWNNATDRHRERQQAINAAKEVAIIKEEVKAAKNGLKSKHERLMILQDQVDATLVDLQDDELEYRDKVSLRRVLKELQAEISKIEGDYPAIKTDITSNGGAIESVTMADVLAAKKAKCA
jgi:sulfate adenylyltransferase subunit 1 (EFTu-like GTPase family)